jgi:hypothetical protein
LWFVPGTDDPSARPFWLGSDSFDKGVGVSHYTLRVTHHIDADLDAERDFLAAALARTGRVIGDYQISGVGPTPLGRNGGGDPYFTDGDVEIEKLIPGCAKPIGRAAPTHEQSSWPVQLRSWVWRVTRPFNEWLSAHAARWNHELNVAKSSHGIEGNRAS